MKTKNIFLTLALALSTTFAFAQQQTITSSAHDMSANGWANGGTTEICITCHTPHSAISSDQGAPLWNHLTSTQTFSPYVGNGVGGSLNASVGLPTGTSLLCLSCHDGTTNIDAFGSNLTGTETLPVAYSGTTADLGLDLTTHHPISFTYDATLVNADGGLHATSTVSGISALGTIADDMLFLDKLECASCHDVHNNVPTGVNFLLVKSNTSSALCLTCHNK